MNTVVEKVNIDGEQTYTGRKEMARRYGKVRIAIRWGPGVSRIRSDYVNHSFHDSFN